MSIPPDATAFSDEQGLLARWRSITGELSATARLIAVSKQQPADAITALLAAGQRDFGENRVQEAAEKWPALRERYPGAVLHGIGALQTNKAAQALALFNVIHSVDRIALVDALARARDQVPEARCRHFLVQVNTGEEAQKAGVLPRELSTLLRYCDSKLPIIGLMCIPPAEQAPAPHFAFLATLARDHGLPDLSMGMSEDYAAALRFGATYIRVGTKLFGARLS